MWTRFCMYLYEYVLLALDEKIVVDVTVDIQHD